MKKMLIFNGLLFLILFSILSGCTDEQKATTTGNFENIEFNSETVELIYGKLVIVEENNQIKRADVEYLFENKLPRLQSITVYVNFYDKLGNLIEKSETKTISLPPNYRETGLGPANVISYNEEFAYKIDHVEIIVEELA